MHNGSKILRKQRREVLSKEILPRQGPWIIFLNIILLDLDTISVLITAVCSLQISLSPRGVQKTDESNKLAEPDRTVAKFLVRFRFGSVLVLNF